jgi:hypothetical protein
MQLAFPAFGWFQIEFRQIGRPAGIAAAAAGRHRMTEVELA